MAESRSRYVASHGDRVNLVIHLLAVPLFVVAAVDAVLAASGGDARGMLRGVAGMGVSLAAQGLGHRRERTPPAPFTGPVDALTRVPAEQFWGFWLFLASGAWWRRFRGAP